jgi:hypothetical protein
MSAISPKPLKDPLRHWDAKKQSVPIKKNVSVAAPGYQTGETHKSNNQDTQLPSCLFSVGSIT